MGVQGLLSHCLAQRDYCVEYCDLVETARQYGGLEILVDFYSFEHLIVSNFWKGLANLTGNGFLRIQGGEYQSLHAFVTQLVTDLRLLDIHLVMFIDGAKGSSKIGTEQKLDTWKKRHYSDLGKLNDILSVCTGQRQMRDLPDTTSVRPVLLEVQLMHTLRECNCEIVQVPSGEADFVIAKSLQNRPKAFAVMSNDSDFCIFRDCRFIPNDLFDLNNDLQLSAPQLLPEKPLRLSVGYICANKVVPLLGLQDPSQLVELSIIAGNDFTGPHLHSNLRQKLGFRGKASLQVHLQWVQQYGVVERHPILAKEMQHNRKLGLAVERSRQFYSLTLAEDEVMHKGPLSQFLSEGVASGQFPAHVVAMHHNFYWYRMMLEDTRRGHPCAEFALTELRGYVYRMVLDRREHTVVEYGRTPWQQLDSAGVYAIRDRFVPTADYVNKDQIFKNLRTFHRIMTHQEPEFHIKYFERYGRKNGFTSYVLRYFLVLNTESNLCISMDEFMCVLAVSLGLYKLEVEHYQRLAILPSTRCVTVGNWFQDVYRHAYEYFGKLLHLTHEFPTPGEVWSGAVFTAFFTVTNESGILHNLGFPTQLFNKVRFDMQEIVKEKRHMIRYLVEGIFPFDDRF